MGVSEKQCSYTNVEVLFRITACTKLSVLYTVLAVTMGVFSWVLEICEVADIDIP